MSVEDSHGVACTDCHARPEHQDARINAHLATVACQTCHIPTFAGKMPTKAFWDWSKAGDAHAQGGPAPLPQDQGRVHRTSRTPSPSTAGSTARSGRYLLGDKIDDPEKPTRAEPAAGRDRDRKARIWPFKVHRAKQPYDAGNLYLFPPVTGGKDGYWTNFDWDQAFRLGAKASNIAYSGRYGFARTEMYWPLSHMVAPKEKALSCTDCHGERSRIDWKALGYAGDPMKTGGRP